MQSAERIVPMRRRYPPRTNVQRAFSRVVLTGMQDPTLGLDSSESRQVMSRTPHDVTSRFLLDQAGVEQTVTD